LLGLIAGNGPKREPIWPDYARIDAHHWDGSCQRRPRLAREGLDAIERWLEPGLHALQPELIE
jgi:hypothetical protein